jgi:hypothetical protein
VSHNYTGNSSNNPTAIPLPDDGDPPTAASVNVPFEGLMDKCVTLLDGDVTIGGVKTFGAQVIFQDEVDLQGGTIVISGAPPDWQLNDSPTFIRAVKGLPTDGTPAPIAIPATLGVSPAILKWPLDLPHGCEITEVFCRIDPASGTAAATRVSCQILAIKRDGTTSTPANVQDAVTGASYVAAHEADFVVSVTIDNAQYSYFIQLTGESGANSGNVAVNANPFCAITVSNVDFGR